MYGEHPLGYDTGFYRNRITEESVRPPINANAVFLSTSIGGDIVMRALIALGLDNNSILYGSHILTGLFNGVCQQQRRGAPGRNNGAVGG